LSIAALRGRRKIMAQGVEAAVEGVELEAFATEIPSLIAKSNTLYSMAKDMFQKVPTSDITSAGGTARPSFRVPFRAQSGLAISQGTGNGDSLGRGNMSLWGSFALSPVFHYGVCEMSHRAQVATNGKKRGLISLKAEELKNSLDSFEQGIEGILYGDSSGAITQIPSTATVSSGSGTGAKTSYITGIRSLAFTDNQVVQFYPSEGGTSRGTATISYVDGVGETVWFSTALPSTGGATAVGDYIMIAGSSGALGQGVYGVSAWHNSATTGTIAGVNRATYPSRITTPSINLSGGSVTASLSQRINSLLARAMGTDNTAQDSGVFLIPETQAYAIAQTTVYNKAINYQEMSSSGNTGKVPDVSKKYFQDTYGGRKTHLSLVQPKDRIDLMVTKSWYLGEMVPVQMYDYGGGNTVVPVPDPDGNGWLTSNQFAYEVAFNVANSAPRWGQFTYGASVPTI
jgi:hypothetical protein